MEVPLTSFPGKTCRLFSHAKTTVAAIRVLSFQSVRKLLYFIFAGLK